MILKDTTLAAIVRDEKINPAGGIKRFVESHVPYVEKAVIVDTGSIDGTREILEELESQYPNLSICDHDFINYPDARNYSMSQVQTKRTLILDADELICHEKPEDDFQKINDFIEEHPSKIYRIPLLQILPSGLVRPNMENHYWDHRLFDLESLYGFGTRMFEDIEFKGDQQIIKKIPSEIVHFLPTVKARDIKVTNRYGRDNDEKSLQEIFLDPPSHTEDFAEWKKYNPQRDNFI
jgi:glycosyltransferase involved in cell wall biosynthesis